MAALLFCAALTPAALAGEDWTWTKLADAPEDPAGREIRPGQLGAWVYDPKEDDWKERKPASAPPAAQMKTACCFDTEHGVMITAISHGLWAYRYNEVRARPRVDRVGAVNPGPTSGKPRSSGSSPRSPRG